MPGRDHNQSIEKCFNILDCLHSGDHLLTLEEISRTTGYKKTTCFRLLKTMQTLGVLELFPGTKKYQYGPRLTALMVSALKGISLRRSALPILRRLRDQTRETVNLALLSGSEIVYIERVVSDYLVNANVEVGERLPVYCASMGKVILAFMPEEELEKIIAGIEFKPRTGNTIVSRAALLKELEQIRAKGFAVNNEELEIGLRAVAAPIFNYRGIPFAATNIAWTTSRRPEREAFEQIAPQIVAAAKEISRLMGYSPGG